MHCSFLTCFGVTIAVKVDVAFCILAMCQLLELFTLPHLFCMESKQSPSCPHGQLGLY